MKILIILLFLNQAAYSQAVWVVWNDSLFIKRGADSVYYDEYMFFDNIIRLKASKQNTLVSGTNIKTINSTSILGSGDIVVAGSAAFSSITGVYTDNASLVTGLGLKQNTITTGTASQYFKGDLTLATFPTTTAAFTNSTNKNFVTDAQATVIGNTSGTNSGDNSVNSTYASDFRAANFISGTHYLAPNGNGSSLTGLTASLVGLGNVTNESKATMFTSPTFTGAVTIPAGTIGIPVWSRVTGSNVTTTGQALVNITGLSNALVANATYEFEAVLSVSTTAVTTGTGYGVNFSAAGAAVESHITGALTTAASKTLRINALNTSSQAWLTTSAQTGGILIKGIVTTTANAGNFTISHLKVTSGTSTVFINSYLKTTRIL